MSSLPSVEGLSLCWARTRREEVKIAHSASGKENRLYFMLNDRQVLRKEIYSVCQRKAAVDTKESSQ